MSERDGERDPAESSEPPRKTDAAADPFADVRGTWGFPGFAQDFPHDAELAALVTAYAAGDYATVRTGAPALAAKTTNDDVKRAARVLRARIEPDPSSRLLFGLTAALLIFLFGWWATHDGPNRAAPSPANPPAVERVN